jgi:hypothetical protein
MPPSSIQIQVKPPTSFTGAAVLIVCVYGLLLVIPVLVAMMVVSVLQFGFWTFFIPFLAICAATYLLPFGFGNAHVTRLVRRLPGQERTDGFIVQLTFTPRLRSGLRALIEDADDVGHLTASEAGLVFHGDSVHLVLPREHIRDLRIQSIGPRGLFIYPRLVFAVSGLAEISELRFADRSAWVLPTARKRTRELYQRLAGNRHPL